MDPLQELDPRSNEVIEDDEIIEYEEIDLDDEEVDDAEY